MRFVRDIFTGELREAPSEGGRRKIIARTTVPEGTVDPRRKSASAWGRTWRGTALRVHPDQVPAFNEAARAAQTGAYYAPDGTMRADSDLARVREYARRGFVDMDGGYSQTVDITPDNVETVDSYDEVLDRLDRGDRLI